MFDHRLRYRVSCISRFGAHEDGRQQDGQQQRRQRSFFRTPYRSLVPSVSGIIPEAGRRPGLFSNYASYVWDSLMVQIPAELTATGADS